MFRYFWMEGRDLPEGIGFGLFTPAHFMTLAVCAAGVILIVRSFLRRSPSVQKIWLRVLAVMMLLGNIARDIFLLLKGRMNLSYLPFHLCSFAIFVYLLYAFFPDRYPRASHFRAALGEIGCVLLLPGTVTALIFPDWSAYPLLNFMCIHSFLWHSVLSAFPLMLALSHRVRPDIRHIWYPVIYLAILVPPTLIFDRLFNVNYLFINWPLPDTPLMKLYEFMGPRYWLVGYAVLVFLVILAEYTVIEAVRAVRKSMHAERVK